MATLSVDRHTAPGILAAKLAGGSFREQTAQARGWCSDCWHRLPDGRLVSSLGTADVWYLVATQYVGGIEAFLADGGVA